MLDTIILTIPINKVIKFPRRNKDYPEWNLYKSDKVFSKWVINQTPTQKKDGIYRPRLRYIKRGKMGFMQIEFSAPKILYGNNLNEVMESDFDLLLETLNKRIHDFNIGIWTSSLASAEVSSFHPSKNIVLRDGYTSSYIIKELNKINLTQKMDLTKDRFSNEGQALQYYSNSHSFVIYDKIQDLKKPKGRAIDKDQTSGQLSLFNDSRGSSKFLEILRMEVRICNKTKLNSIMCKVGYPKNPTFRDVFNKSICQKIVKMYWQELIADNNLFLFDKISSPQQILQNIIKNNPNLKPNRAIYLVGLNLLAKDEKGIRGLRATLNSYNSQRNWYRIADDLKEFNSFTLTESQGWVDQIERQIALFEPLKLSPFYVKKSKV